MYDAKATISKVVYGNLNMHEETALSYLPDI